MIEWFVLAAYRAMSGYGLRSWRALAWFVAVAIVGTAAFDINGLDLDLTAVTDRASIDETFTFSVRSMVSFFSPPAAELKVAEQWIQLGLRFAGPILLAQAVLALRERVAR